MTHNDFLRIWIGLSLIIFVAIISLFHQYVFAEETPSDVISVPLNSIFDWFRDFISANVQSMSWNQDTKDNIDNFVGTGTETGKTGVSLWVGVHKTLVDGIIALGGQSFDAGIILLIAFVVSTVLVGILLWKIIKHFWKVFVIILIIIAGIFFLLYFLGASNASI